MENVDLILRNAHILCMDKNFTQYQKGALAVKNDTIIAIDDENIILQNFTSTEFFDCQHKILMPGLINTHTHVPMTLLRGLSDDLRLDVWLMGYIMPTEREFVSKEFVKVGTKLACAEFIRSGITCFADMYYFEESIAEVTAEIGLRALLSESVLKFPSPDSTSYEEALAYAEAFIAKWKGHHLIIPSVAPHAPYTCTDEILQSCAKLAQKYDVPLQIHLSETVQEVENIRKEKGMPVIPYMKKLGLFDAKVIGAHCIHIDEGEMRKIRNMGAGIAHNPSSNLKLSAGFAPVTKMLEVGLNVGIGTDGPASNNDLDMFKEMRLTALLAKGVTSDPTAIPAKMALLMATRMGAQAIHMSHLTGSLEVGKKADLIILNTKTLHNTPKFKRNNETIYSQIVYASKSTDVTDVMVNGKWLMTDRNLLTINEEDLFNEASQYAEKIDAFFIQREQDVLTKLISIGGATEEESFEVQLKIPLKDTKLVLEALKLPLITVSRFRHYKEYDTYMMFEDNKQGYLRYREDAFVNDSGNTEQIRNRLTLIGQNREAKLDSNVLLSRSRFISPAIHSLRFYREYFKPKSEMIIEKDRLRWLVKYQETEFFVNIDTIIEPKIGTFLEVKTKTWSRTDAQHKAILAADLLYYLGLSVSDATHEDYFSMIIKLKSKE